ncbi:DUF3718 domain-containing protein [Pseudidiomarina sp.]|uniref:DUF3718 domain-containing protein n=1 Tax=Pseudidiomarina sp. TaxID=2081707 RepID=UPI00299E8AA4|nr:DUF3718 domain-containing protein [Pseudidiomarina sp.]MDX1705286.1 DUF3718 domain-containing protein [Pseudidiomarina sp.]
MFPFVARCLLLLAAIGTLLPVSPARAQALSGTDELALVFCTYVRDNDSNRLRSKLRAERMRMRDIYSSVRCNDSSLIQFALRHKSYEIGRYIAASVEAEDLLASGDYEWARQHQLLDNPIGQVLRSRLVQ